MVAGAGSYHSVSEKGAAMNDDAQEIRRMLEDRIEQVLDSIAPGWVKRGNTAYLSPKGPKDLGSFTVSLGGNNKMPRGCFYRFSQSVGGGSLELVAYQLYGRKDAYREAFGWARDFLGIRRSEETEDQRKERQDRQEKERDERKARERDEAKKKAERDAQRTLSAQQVWEQTKPLQGTHGEAYLIARGIPPISEWPWNPIDTIRFHPSLGFEPDRDAGQYPAVVAKVVDAFGGILGVWQIYVDREKPQKADLDPSPKIGRGPCVGGAIRVGGDGPHIGGAEGLETALGAWFLDRCQRPCWSFMSTSGMKGFEPPIFVERVSIWPDGDKAVLGPNGQILEPPGIKAARDLQSKMKAAGIRCVLNETCRLGDALDMFIAMRRFEKCA